MARIAVESEPGTVRLRVGSRLGGSVMEFDPPDAIALAGEILAAAADASGPRTSFPIDVPTQE